jgi:Anthrone oxygenase
MFLVLQVVTVLLVAVAFALALAHALELPGKLRLEKQTYLAVQPIYYPGFTLGAGVGEAGGIAATLMLLLLTPPQTPAFALTLAALVGLLSMHAAYWMFTHPLNKFWLKGEQLAGFSGGFIGFDPLRRDAPDGSGADDWKDIRNRWEYSHVLRAVLAGISFALLVIAVAV